MSDQLLNKTGVPLPSEEGDRAELVGSFLAGQVSMETAEAAMLEIKWLRQANEDLNIQIGRYEHSVMGDFKREHDALHQKVKELEERNAENCRDLESNEPIATDVEWKALEKEVRALRDKAVVLEKECASLREYGEVEHSRAAKYKTERDEYNEVAGVALDAVGYPLQKRARFDVGEFRSHVEQLRKAHEKKGDERVDGHADIENVDHEALADVIRLIDMTADRNRQRRRAEELQAKVDEIVPVVKMLKDNLKHPIETVFNGYYGNQTCLYCGESLGNVIAKATEHRKSCPAVPVNQIPRWVEAYAEQVESSKVE